MGRWVGGRLGGGAGGGGGGGRGAVAVVVIVAEEKLRQILSGASDRDTET